jgi:hypothetical protein
MDELILLVKGMKSADGMGAETIRPSPTEKRAVYAEIRSIGTTEYYQAKAYDNVPDMKAVMYKEEYGGEPFVERCGKTYAVKRVYETDEVIELTCGEARV